jgi:cytochrome c peroxidase
MRISTPVLMTGLALAAGCQSPQPAVPFTPDELRRVYAHSPLPPARPDPTNAVGDDPAAARLGHYLFFDTRLSATGSVSCATCHDPARFWSDGRPLSRAIGVTRRHAPTLLNTALNRWFFWDGRADSHWSQALKPIEDPDEHGATRLQSAHVLLDDPELRRAYERLFGALPELSDGRRFPRAGRPVPHDPEHPHHRAWASMRPEDQEAVNRVFANLGKAIAAFVRRLVSRQTPFDTFVEGLREGNAKKLAALSVSAQRGLKLFIGEAGCRQCHVGPNFTDGEFHSIGLPPLDGSAPDLGRYAGVAAVLADPFNGLGAYSDDPTLAGREELKFLKAKPENFGQFKVPTLRNVGDTAPYMHDGRFASLAEVLEFYSTQAGTLSLGHHQETVLRPLDLSDTEIEDIIAFLESLSGPPPDPSLTRQPPSPLP